MRWFTEPLRSKGYGKVVREDKSERYDAGFSHEADIGIYPAYGIWFFAPYSEVTRSEERRVGKEC